MNVSDIIIDFLVKQRVSDVFLLTGGHVSFLLDHFHGREDIDYVCVAHEQAAAMAADGFSRIRPDSIGVAIATSGPGATNLLTGVGCSWFDSIPCLLITGQVNRHESRGDLPVRQIGFQEMDIIGMAKPITKFAETVDAPENILYFLEKALHIAKSGRPGPVLLDIPMDIQRMEVEEDQLTHFTPDSAPTQAETGVNLDEVISQCADMVNQAERPVILAGGGVRNADATGQLLALSEKIQAPVCVSMNGIDTFPHDHPNYAGFIGVYGNRGGNLAIANCDLLLCIGTRLDSRQTGVKTEQFSRFSKKIVVDIDPNELGVRVTPDVALPCDARVFLDAMLKRELMSSKDSENWLAKIGTWKEAYPPCPVECNASENINHYMLMERLSDHLGPDDMITLDTGQNMVAGIQAIRTRERMRMWTAGGMSPMGYSLPAAMGAAYGNRKGRAVCVIGDGGLQINIQELETIVRENLPLITIVVNNACLGLICQFQDDYLGSRHVAADPPNGYTTPDFVRIAEAYNMPAAEASTPAELDAALKQAFASEGPMLLNVMVDASQPIVPKALMQHPMEDQYPYVPEEEFLGNMLVEPIDPKTYRVKD